MKARRAFVIPAMLALSACATQPQEPVYRDRVQIVEKPIAINCIKFEDKPVRPLYRTEMLPKNATDLMVADALGSDWAKSRVYEQKMEAAVNACLLTQGIR